MEEGKERVAAVLCAWVCVCVRACVSAYRTSKNRGIQDDKQDTKEIDRIKQQLERMQMVLHFCFRAGYACVCMCVCVRRRGCTQAYFVLEEACSEQTLHALYCLSEKSITCV